MELEVFALASYTRTPFSSRSRPICSAPSPLAQNRVLNRPHRVRAPSVRAARQRQRLMAPLSRSATANVPSSLGATSSSANATKIAKVSVRRVAGQPFGVMLSDPEKSITVTGVQLAYLGAGVFAKAGLQKRDVLTSINGKPCDQGHEAASKQLSALVGEVIVTVYRPPPTRSLTNSVLSVFSRKSDDSVGFTPTAVSAAEEEVRREEAAKLLQAHIRGHKARASMPDGEMPNGETPAFIGAPTSMPGWFARCLAPCLGGSKR